MVVMLPLDATAGSPAFTAQQTRQAFSALAGPAPSGRPLGAKSGVRLGTPTTTATLSGAGSTTWNVATHSGVLDTQTAAAAGPYFYATDGSDTGTITAANATLNRIDILYVKVNDNVQDGSGLTSGQVLYLAGTAASSPAIPSTPARGMAIASISVPHTGGGTPAISWIAPIFTPDTYLTQIGVGSISASGAAAGSLIAGTTVNFPIAYSTTPPSVFVSILDTGVTGANQIVFRSALPGTFGFTTNFLNTGSSATFTGLQYKWVAIGLA